MPLGHLEEPMPNSLEEYLIKHIKDHGPIDVGQFMEIALGHPQHGYYMKQDPFGANGDFTTAPEISQMFGEMIGAWAADIWIQMGKPKPCMLLECGPGRGTLMADILRATKNVTDFHDSVRVHLLEMSPVLRSIQMEVIGANKVHFHESIHSVAEYDESMPVIIIANEFFDALPVRQLQRTEAGWQEKIVGLTPKNKLNWAYRPAKKDIIEYVDNCSDLIDINNIFEVSPIRLGVKKQISNILSDSGGAVLIVDYGHVESASGDTLQAVRNHKFCDVLSDVGNADLTAHVDFEALIVTQCDPEQIHGPVTQSAFLKTLGIEKRAEYLRSVATEKQASDIDKALKRLTDADQMGSLFKVLSFTHGQFNGKHLKPAGF